MTGRYVFIFLAGCILPLSAAAQERCSTSKYEAQRLAERPGRESVSQFEDWIKSRLATLPQITSATYTIPVVVHVLHNGTTDVTNISDAQIYSQMDVLNKDFKRLNVDAVNTPSEFAPVAGTIDIDFVLAQRDPEGLPTSGITRTLATKTMWTLADQSEFKALSYWPAEDYLNIWIVSFGTNDIGFAQFPVSSLQGLQIASEDRLTDGIVVDYRAFGTIDAGSFPLMANYNKGRTATHEVGHFLGLRHIWGDMSTCADNDFVSDTPFQSGPTSSCPTHPQISCSVNKMFMNYMDYTFDACMNIFTAGQVARMVAVLASSPRRASLLTSLGATPPVVAMNDLGIRQIISPAASTCNNQVIPQLEVRNYGTNTITSATVEIDVDGQLTQVPLSLNLAPGQLITQTFSPVLLASGTGYTFTFTILDTNGGPDGNPQNNQVTRAFTNYGTTALPLLEPSRQTG
jgi:Pregnancy-associated plasma protein-A/CARDB